MDQRIRKIARIGGRLSALLLLVAFFFLNSIAIGQSLKVRINLSPRPDPYISTWANSSSVLIVTVTNSTPNSIDTRFDCKITLNGVLQASTNPTRMPTLTVRPGTTLYFARDVIPQQAVTFHSDVDRVAARTGMLKAGTYSVCVSLLDPNTLQAVSEQACRPLMLTSYQAPILIQPEDKSDLATTQRPMFRWIGVSPRPQSQVYYRLQVFEILAGQNVTRAFMVNKPILDKSRILTTQLMWPPDVELPREGMDYAWSVTATDILGNPIGEPRGLGGPFSFRTRPKAVAIKNNLKNKIGIGPTDSTSLTEDSAAKRYRLGENETELKDSASAGRFVFRKAGAGSTFTYDVYETDSTNRMIEGSRFTMRSVVSRTDARISGKTDVLMVENEASSGSTAKKDTAYYKYESANNFSILLEAPTLEGMPRLLVWSTLPVGSSGVLKVSGSDSLQLSSDSLKTRTFNVSAASIGNTELHISGDKIATKRIALTTVYASDLNGRIQSESKEESILNYAPSIGFLARRSLPPQQDPLGAKKNGKIQTLVSYELR
jgi:hypothetical protein